MYYTIKARQLNSFTLIYVVDVVLLDGGDIKNQWCIRFLVSISEACSTSFHKFLEKFIRRVYITDSVLSSIGAFELMVFQNRIDLLDFPDKQHKAQDMLKYFMILKSITVVEHDDFFRWSHFQRLTRSNNVPIQKRKQENCEPQEFGSWYQIANSKMCVLNIQSYRYLLT